MTHGYKRAEILSTHFNGATLLVLALLIPTRASRASNAPTGIASLIIAAIMLSAATGD